MYLLGVRVFTNTLRCSKGGMDIIHESGWIIELGFVTVDTTEEGFFFEDVEFSQSDCYLL